MIGTNGAGKSTLINMLSGEMPATSGSIHFDGHDITDWSQPQARARRHRPQLPAHDDLPGVQRAGELPPVRAGRRCRAPGRCGKRAQRCAASLAAAREALAGAGLADDAQRIAGTLSHGGKRQLEIAMCLATRPRVLLLDEPLAGMGAEETDRMLALLAALKQTHAVLLVEHDMDAVFRIADRITVMVNGEVIASDAPAAIRGNRDVQMAYLGEGH